jgi:hypothetical protein
MMWQFGMFARLWTHRRSGWMQRKFGAGMFFTLSLVILLLTYIIYCRCIEHSIHLMACHFVTALNVPGIGRTKKKIHAPGSAQQDLADEFEESFDVDISIDVEALPNDAEAMHAAFDISFEPGDVVGKLLAFIAQVRACSDDVREYLLQIATSLGCPSWEIKLWVRTRWGSLSDCFRTVLAIQKVCNILLFHELSHDNLGRELTVSATSLMKKKTYHPSPMARNGPTTCFLDRNGTSSGLHTIAWRYVSYLPIKCLLNIINRF